MPKQHKWKVGDLCSYDGSDEAFIKFISTEYIVVCTHQWDKDPDLAATSKCKYNQVNVLVYPAYWHQILPRASNGKIN